MSRLEDLIQTLCPDGVENSAIKDCCVLRRGEAVTKNSTNEGPIPVIAGGQRPAYFIDKANRTGETIVVSSSGAYAGFVSYWNTPIFVSDAFSIEAKKGICLKYIFHFLRNRQESIHSLKKGGGVPHVHVSDLAPMIIPIPPLPVQEEIVRILDTFNDVVAELEAEQAARVRQYEYYRDELFINNSNVPVIDLGNLCEFVRGPFGGSLKKEIFINEGFAVYEQQHAIYGDFTFRYFIDQKKFDEMKRFQVKPGDLIMSCSGTMGKVTIIPKNAKEGVINQALLKLRVNNRLNKYFLKYIFQSKAFINALNSRTQGGAIKNVASVAILKTIPIPVPPFEIQEQIVSILDRFDTLVNDLKSGLPAEIALRRKQNEYYRDKLLTFQPLK